MHDRELALGAVGQRFGGRRRSASLAGGLDQGRLGGVELIDERRRIVVVDDQRPREVEVLGVTGGEEPGANLRAARLS